MKRISALVPDGEHFDATALNEGIWLTVGHVNNIENALETHEASAIQLTTERDTLQQQLTEAQTAAQASATQHQQEIAQRDERIATLQSENEKLKKTPAAEFQATSRPEDNFNPASVPSYADDKNPSNILADSLLGRPATGTPQ